MDPTICGEEFAIWFQQEFEGSIAGERLEKYCKNIALKKLSLQQLLECSTVPELKHKLGMAFGDAKLVLQKLHSLQQTTSQAFYDSLEVSEEVQKILQQHGISSHNFFSLNREDFLSIGIDDDSAVKLYTYIVEKTKSPTVNTVETPFAHPINLEAIYNNEYQEETPAKTYGVKHYISSLTEVGAMGMTKRALKWANHRYGPFTTTLPKSKTEWLKFIWRQISTNWKSGFTVSLVSVPLSISLALASDAIPIQGIITAAWAGLMSASLGGSHYNIMGPTGALSGILSMYAVRYSPDILPLIALLSGILIFIIFLLRLDKYFLFLPASAIQGFTVGVALIITLNQLPLALGLPKLKRHEEFMLNLWESITHVGETNFWALDFFLVCLIANLILIKVLPKVPWTIVLALISVLIGFLIDMGWFFCHMETIYSRYGNLKFELVRIPKFDYLEGKDLFEFGFEVITAVISVTFVAVLETLVSAKIADNLTGSKFSHPREVFGLSMANIFSGLFGGIPATAALARTALNIKTGATSRLSGMISALGIFLISALLIVFRYLLLPVVASILVVVAYRMVEWHEVIHIWKTDKKQFILLVIVAAITVAKDPTYGIVLGMFAAFVMHADEISSAWGEIVYSKGDTTLKKNLREFDSYAYETTPFLDFSKVDTGDVSSAVVIYKMPGELSYLNSSIHEDRVKDLKKDYQLVIVSLSKLYILDCDGVVAIHNIIKEFEKHAKLVLLVGVEEPVRAFLEHEDWYLKMRDERGHVFKYLKEALDFIKNSYDTDKIQITPSTYDLRDAIDKVEEKDVQLQEVSIQGNEEDLDGRNNKSLLY